jgi:hypothetical protein
VKPTTKFIREPHGEPRGHFFRALHHHAPEVEQHLRNDALPKFAAIPETLRQSTERELVITRLKNSYAFVFQGAEPEEETVRQPAPLTWLELREIAKEQQSAGVLRDSLDSWASRFNLSDDWLLDWALKMLSEWHQRGLGGRVPFGGLRSSITAEERRLVFENYGWDLEFENWGAFNKRIHKQFDALLETYGEQLSKLARRRGWVERPDIRRPKSYRWLVLYQVKGLSPARVTEEAGDHDKDTSTILKAVEKAAQLCGLTLRGARKGRTPHSAKKR